MADVNQGSEVGKVATGSYLNSFGSLANLAQQGMNFSNQAGQLAASELSSSATASSNQGDLQIRNQQAAMQNKGAALGAMGTVAGDVAKGGATLATGGTDALLGALAL
jgi:hypothetical protein